MKVMATKPRITIKRLPNGRDADGIIMHYGTACIVISTDSEATYVVWENLLESEYPGWKKHCSDCAEHHSFPDGQDSYDVFWYIPSDELGEFRGAYNAVKNLALGEIRKSHC